MPLNALSNQNCATQPTFINIRPNEYTQGLLSIYGVFRSI